MVITKFLCVSLKDQYRYSSVVVFYRLLYIHQKYIIRLSIDFLDFWFIYRNILAKVIILFFHIRVQLFPGKQNKTKLILQVIDPNLDFFYIKSFTSQCTVFCCALLMVQIILLHKFILYFYVRCCMFTLTNVFIFPVFSNSTFGPSRPYFQAPFLYVCFLARLSRLMLLDANWRLIIHKIMSIAIAFILHSKPHIIVYFNPKPVLPIDQPIDTYILQLFKLHSKSSSVVILVFMLPLGHSL